MSALGGRKTHGRPGRTGSIIRGVGRVAGRAITGAGRMGPRRRRRGRGITKTELRGFRKIVKLLRSVGMVPKGTRRAIRRTTT